MSVDDQLFKKDGTLLTAVDVYILKFARFLARFFLKEDEETFSPVLKRVLRVSCGALASAALFFALSGEIVSAIVGVFLALFYWHLGSIFESRCNGLGTNVSSSSKRMRLFVLIFAPSLFTFHFFDSGRFIFMATCLEIIGIFLYFLTTGYVVRLGNVPPKKKKAKALKPVLSPIP